MKPSKRLSCRVATWKHWPVLDATVDAAAGWPWNAVIGALESVENITGTTAITSLSAVQLKIEVIWACQGKTVVEFRIAMPGLEETVVEFGFASRWWRPLYRG